MILQLSATMKYNKNVALSIDSQGYSQKPITPEPGNIRNRLSGRKAHASLSIEQIAEKIQHGHTIQGARLRDKRPDKKENTDERFIDQQLFYIDIDNDYKDKKTGQKYKLPQTIDTVEQILDICKKAGIEPCIIYESFSSGKKDPNGAAIPKFHVIFASDKLITKNSEARQIIRGLHYTFGKKTVDEACKDPARLLYGTAESKKVYVNYVVNTTEKLLSLAPAEESSPVTATQSATEAEERIQRDFEKVCKNTEADPSRLLMMIDPNNLDYNEWLRVSAAYKFSEGADTELWIAWNNQYSKVNPQADLKTYKALNGKGITKGSLKYFAKLHSPAEWDNYIQELKPQRRKRKVASPAAAPASESQSGTQSEEKMKVYEDGQAAANDGQMSPLPLPEGVKRPENYVDFIFTDGKKLVLSTHLLAENIRKNCKYIFIKGADPAEQVRRFWYVKGVYVPFNDDQIKNQIRNRIQVYNEPSLIKMRYIKEVFELLCLDDNFVNDSEVNADENIINFENGLLHLDTMQITKHTPDILSTIQIPCNYVPGKTLNDAPVFNSFISRLANYDEDSKRTLIEYIGAAISNVDGGAYKKAVFLKGDGNCGKSQYIKLITRLLSDRYCATASLEKLESRFGAYTLYNKRFVADPDTKFIKVAELNVFKKATGGDDIDMEPKGKGIFKAPYKGLLCFGCNTLPLFGGDKGAWVYARILPIQCGPTVTDQERDPKILDKLYSERESIVSIAIAALKETIANKYRFTFSQSSNRLLQEYKIENDVVRQFINECCEIRTDKTAKDGINQKILFNAFLEWIKQSNIKHAASKKEFNKSLLEIAETTNQKVIEYKLHGGIRYYVWTLTQEAKQELHAFDSTPK